MPYTGVPHANTQALRAALQAKCAAKEAELAQKRKSHKDLRPENTRWLHPETYPDNLTTPPYIPFEETLGFYDVEIRENSPIHHITDRHHQPGGADSGWDKGGDLRMKKEMCKPVWLATGVLSDESITRFIPVGFRGPGLEETRTKWIDMVRSVERNLRSGLSAFLIPIILDWVQDPRFLAVDTTSKAARLAYWAIKEGEDKSVAYESVNPYASTLDRNWIWYSGTIPNEEERALQTKVKAFIKAFFHHACDTIFMLNIDQDAGNPAHKFFMYKSKLKGELQAIYKLPDIAPLIVHVGKFPSFTSIHKVRTMKKGSASVLENLDDWIPMSAFREPDTDEEN